MVGKPVIAGALVKHGDIEELITINEASLRGLIPFETATYLLEAQAATGMLYIKLKTNIQFV